MNLEDLSSNWRDIKNTIKKGPPKVLRDHQKRLNSQQPLETGRSNSDKSNSRSSKKRKLATLDGQDFDSSSGSPSSSSTHTFKKVKRGSFNPKPEKKSDQSHPFKTPASLALWAEDNDIPLEDVASAYRRPLGAASTKYQDKPNEGLSTVAEIGNYVALDCEMVGVGRPERSVLARVSVVNYHGEQVYDSYVQPGAAVTNWRTWVSGIESKHMVNARAMDKVQSEIKSLLAGRTLIGHSLANDFGVLDYEHPRSSICDTAKLRHFRQANEGRTPSLKNLCLQFLGLEIQSAEHSSVEDARACMLLFRRFQNEFELQLQFNQRSAKGIKRQKANSSNPQKKKSNKGSAKKKGRTLRKLVLREHRKVKLQQSAKGL
ncbi:MAG: 3'-5' exonuclease [Vezdaea aestivalis]|nr:MAG: 3'-5' exonuclease [Vezdaea aestivalis]